MIYVLPGGKITGAGLLAFCNATEGVISTYSYNGGEINVGTLNLNGGTLYNAANAQLTVTELKGGDANSRLVNQGNAIVFKLALISLENIVVNGQAHMVYPP